MQNFEAGGIKEGYADVTIFNPAIEANMKMTLRFKGGRLPHAWVAF
jgi:hypothetical protein